ncbi:MAG: ATP-binding cassette domain-containing protein [Acholeplasmatales bacterium]|nr:ATP-binding cassette domain-containing protein [Acholeplasmatales bacterium]
MDYIIETENLTKQFPGKLAVDHINMHIKKGDIYGFIGRNGAGKTTAMKMIAGLTKVTYGSIKLFGSSDLDAGRKKMGILIEDPGIYKNCTAFENLKRFSILSGGTDDDIREILKFVGLADTGNRKAGAFSLGMKQRLGIAIALLGNPELLVLDEPINGLDPEGIKEIRDTLIKLNKEKGITILISSHLLDELAKITNVYGIINNGVLVEEISAEDLRNQFSDSFKVRVDDPNRAVTVLKEAGLLEHYEINGMTIKIYDHIHETDVINKCLVNADIKVYEIELGGSFEQYFIERIGK